MKENFGLYLILTDPVSGYETCAKAAVESGVRYLQLRMKNTTPDMALETAIKLRNITHDSETRFIVNDDLNIAIQSDADGIHLGQGDMGLAEARGTWNRSDKLFGLSTHDMEQAVQAQMLKPDLIGIGPVFPTRTKILADPALGAKTTGRIAQEIPLTSVAIGGINADNLPSVLEAGSVNFCVVSAVNNSPNPLAAIQTLQEIWKNHSF
ncbi:MAG: thiamine phosphate synthase [Pontiella sp.]